MRKRIDGWKTMVMAGLLGAVGVLPALAQAEELPLGSRLPMADRAMQNVAGGTAALAGLKGAQGTVIAFWSNECPWVSKYEDRFLELAGAYAGRGFGFVVVNANDPVAFPQEAAAESQRRAPGQQVSYLMDGGSELAKALGASRTPHIYVFDANDTLVYVGTIDDSPGDPTNVQKQYLKDALDALLAGQPLPVAKTKAFGCTIKFQ